MGAVLVSRPHDVQEAIDREVAAGRFASEADFLAMAPRRYADHLAAEDGLRAIAEAGIDAGRYTLFANAADPDALHEGALARLRERLDAFS